MLGPLPRLHRRVLVAVAVLLFLTAGVIAGLLSTVPLVMPVALTTGAALGLAAAFVLVHDFSHR
ncbi:OapA N-terminal domain-containing protein [Nocardioides alkalitolerans]|uniref:OapA N-terminal domain-containing protein n=1 Tax=Nocardioides alkalitolerans TaxID=281714 RepID=UPI0004277060|nr:OapA N-terminal domain-containing protein [Nocardioides alkalitolerans]